MEQIKLTVTMFGEFSIYAGDVPVVGKDNRSDDVVKLLQYLLLSRSRIVTQEELVSVIMQAPFSDSKAKALASLVTKLRKLFNAAGLDGKECVIYSKGAYALSDDIEYQVDAEIFGNLVKRVMSDARGDERTLKTCLSALEMYKGDFLSKTAGEMWIVGRGVQYQDMYASCVRKAYEVAGKMNAYIRVNDALKRASEMYPYDEDFYTMYISCLYELGKTKEAMRKYNEVVSMLLENFGIEPSGKVKEIHEKMTHGNKNEMDSIYDIRQNLVLEDESPGAYYCDFEGFANIYKFVVRHIERSGQSVYLMLCTISDLSGMSTDASARTSRISAAFREASRVSFRKGDVYTRYGPSQFLFILMNISREECDTVANRVQSNFMKISKMDDLRMACRFITAIDMDRIMQKQGFGLK